MYKRYTYHSLNGNIRYLWGTYNRVRHKLEKRTEKVKFTAIRKRKNRNANAQSISFPALPTIIASLSNTCFFADAHFCAD